VALGTETTRPLFRDNDAIPNVVTQIEQIAEENKGYVETVNHLGANLNRVSNEPGKVLR